MAIKYEKRCPACYSAQTGRLEKCKTWFKQAMAVDENTVRRVAMKVNWWAFDGFFWI